MISKDYTKEIGMHTDQRVVPLRFVLPVLVTVLAVGVWLGFAKPEAEKVHDAPPVPAATGK